MFKPAPASVAFGLALMGRAGCSTGDNTEPAETSPPDTATTTPVAQVPTPTEPPGASPRAGPTPAATEAPTLAPGGQLLRPLALRESAASVPLEMPYPLPCILVVQWPRRRWVQVEDPLGASCISVCKETAG